MLGNWFRKSTAALEPNVRQELSSSVEPATFVKLEAPATLIAGDNQNSAAKAAGAFDIATMALQPGGSFENATVVAGGSPPVMRSTAEVPLPTRTVHNGRYEHNNAIGRG